MIDLAKVRNFYIACGYTDLRLGIDGLAAVVTQQYGSHLDEESLFLFCDSVKGVESSAIVYPLVETANANGIEPYEYLMLVLSMLPYLGKSPAHEELEKLMPWHPAVRHREHIRK